MSSSYQSPASGSGITEKVGTAARSAAENLKTKAVEATKEIRSSVAGMAEEQRDRVAHRMDGVGSALHESAESSRAEDPNIAWLTEQASQRLQHAADYVRGCSWPRLREDSADLARRHPVAFFGGMFVLGAVTGAVIKAAVQSGTEAVHGDTAETDDHPPFAAADENVPTADHSPVASTF